MPRYRFVPPRPDYPAASVAHFASAALIPECQKYLNEGSHRRLYSFSPEDYGEVAGISANGEVALPGDPQG